MNRRTIALVKYLCVLVLYSLTSSCYGADADTLGVTLLRQVDFNLQGYGVYVAQPEATDAGVTNFEVNPLTVGQPASLFTWISSGGTATNFPNSVGIESGHADAVAANFYGVSTGVAPYVSHVDNYDADHFVFKYVWPGTNTPARVVNQSFIFSTNFEASVNQKYDDYATLFGTLFVSGIGNGNVPVSPPATSYNGIGVGVYGTPSSIGPTSDGRSKPDLVAPGGATSFSTPYVAGSAAVLIQAANRGDGGSDTNAANNLRTIKALLLNGAVKPDDWTNGPSTPLDARYGAGIVNLFNSWIQLKGGRHSFIETTVNSGGPHPPGLNTNNEPVNVGWDWNSISTQTNQNCANHYYFRVSGNNFVTFTATLVWTRQEMQTTVNDLDLLLYNTTTSNLVVASTSAVDNVEHLYLPQLAPGRYDLQVFKNGSISQISSDEDYALAFEMFNVRLDIRQTNGQVALSWPIAPTGFQLQSTPNLLPPIQWNSVNAPVLVDTNANRNSVTVPAGDPARFFRLKRP